MKPKEADLEWPLLPSYRNRGDTKMTMKGKWAYYPKEPGGNISHGPMDTERIRRIH